jgi:hypothetical protein
MTETESKSSSRQHIQGLWGRGLQSPQLVADGAILVGHSFKYPLRWGNRGEPEEGEPEISAENSNVPPHDSGIGSSNTSQSAEGSRPARHLQPARSPLGRPDIHEVDSSDSAIFMHANQQFVHGGSSQSGLERNAEMLILPSSSNAGSQGSDRRTAGSRGKRRSREREATDQD